MEVDRRAFIASLGGTAAVSLMDHEAKAEALEHWMEERLDEAVEQQGGAQQKFPSAAELEAQIETRSYRRGVGNLFVNTRGGMMKKLRRYRRTRRSRISSSSAAGQSRAAERHARAEDRDVRGSGPRLSAARRRAVDDQGRSRLVGRAVVRAVHPREVDVRDRYHQALRFYPDSMRATNIPTKACASSATTTRRRRTSKPPTRWCATTSGAWSGSSR